MFGNPEVTPGGRALKFYSSIRLDVRRSESIKQGVNLVGNKVKVKVVKNKVAPPFKVAELEIVYGEGLSTIGEVIDLAVEHDILNKAGAWYSYKEERIGQGRETVKNFLTENKDVYEEIYKQVQAQLFQVISTDEAIAD